MKVRYTNPVEKRQALAARRLKIFSLLLGLGYLIIIIRAFSLMVQDNQHLETLALQQYRTAIQPEVSRRRILDRKGAELAISVPAWSLYADPSEVKNHAAASLALARILNIPPEVVEQKLSKAGHFVWIRRGVDADTMEKIKPLRLAGIYSLRENTRSYPHGGLAGNLLGAVGIDFQALGGIELAYDHYLRVQPPAGVYLRDAKGRLYLASTSVAGFQDKGDVYLTLDKNLQFIAEEALHQAVKKHHAEGGAAILLDPKSGDILAMANSPSFNPNHFAKAGPKQWRNRAITDIYEPGSTFKMVFIAAALEQQLLSFSEKINCENGAWRLPGGHFIHDSEPHGWLDVREIVKVSSNIGAAKVAQKLGEKKMYEWMKAFGFGQKTGIDFPSEAKGLIRHYQEWSQIEAATIAFGQGVGVTPLQMLSLFAAIANQGAQLQPHLVEKVVSEEGEILYQATHQTMRTPLQPATAKRLGEILQGVVLEGGTATLAYLEDYPVAGKTGTSQKSIPGVPGYLAGKYISSFIGFVPLNDPKLVGLVLIDEPVGSYYGGTVAAPVFKEIMLRALTALGIPPQGTTTLVASALPARPRPYPSTMLKPMGHSFEVPNFAGATLRQVLQAVNPYPVHLELKGRGVAFKQQPKPGTLVLAGSKIYVEFAPLY